MAKKSKKLRLMITLKSGLSHLLRQHLEFSIYLAFLVMCFILNKMNARVLLKYPMRI